MSTTVVFAITAVVVCISLWTRRRRADYPPGYNGLPILGCLPFVSGNQAADFLKWGKQLDSSIFYVRMGLDDIIVLNDYEAIHECIVAKANSASGRPPTQLFNDVRKNRGLVFKDYDKDLKSNRKFFLSCLKRFGGITSRLDEFACAEMDYLSKEILKNGGIPFEIKEAVFESTCALISKVAIGKRLDYKDETVKTLVKGSQLLLTNKDIGNLPFLLLMEYRLRYFPKFSRAYKFFVDLYQRRADIFRELIEEHRSTYDSSSIRDAIDAYFEQHQIDPKAISEDEFVYVLVDIFDGGTETTTNTINWCIFYLAHSLATQQTLRNEIADVIGERAPRYSDKANMPLMSSFMDEILRHRTVAPIGALHKAQESFYLHGYRIPKNATILTNIWAAHRDEENFSDPDKFIPDRFIDKETGKYSKPTKFMPFGVGLRKCPGFDMAERVVFLLVTSILQKFQIRKDPNHPLPDFNEGILSIVYFAKEYKVICSPEV